MTLEQMLRLDEVAVARKSDPATSHEAADHATGHVWESQQATLAILAATRRPMTALAVEEYAAKVGLPFSAARMRSTLPELEEKRMVKRDGFSKPPKGRRRVLWVLT